VAQHPTADRSRGVHRPRCIGAVLCDAGAALSGLGTLARCIKNATVGSPRKRQRTGACDVQVTTRRSDQIEPSRVLPNSGLKQTRISLALDPRCLGLVRWADRETDRK
jgi:hypothetical protein